MWVVEPIKSANAVTKQTGGHDLGVEHLDIQRTAIAKHFLILGTHHLERI